MKLINKGDVVSKLGKPFFLGNFTTHNSNGIQYKADFYSIRCLKCNENMVFEVDLRGIINKRQDCKCGNSKHNYFVTQYIRNFLNERKIEK